MLSRQPRLLACFVQLRLNILHLLEHLPRVELALLIILHIAHVIELKHDRPAFVLVHDEPLLIPAHEIAPHLEKLLCAVGWEEGVARRDFDLRATSDLTDSAVLGTELLEQFFAGLGLLGDGCSVGRRSRCG